MNKVVLFDLEHNMPTAHLLRELLLHYPTVYLFNCQGLFEYALEDLTEFSGWLSSGRMVVLDVPKAEHKEYEYAMLVGQLLALLEPEIQIEVMSAMLDIDLLMQLLAGAELDCSLIQLQKETSSVGIKGRYQLPSAKAFRDKPALQLVKKYCDVLGQMAGKPTTLEGLKNSVSNILQVLPEKAQHVVGMLINLKIVKRYGEQVAYRKKVLKQWLQLKLEDVLQEMSEPVQDDMPVSMPARNMIEQQSSVQDLLPKKTGETEQKSSQGLYENFTQTDELQWKMAQQLGRLKTEKPRDIFALRDLLQKIYPEADVKLLLKELLEKGYIYWNGHEVLYSHELMLQ